MKQTHHIPRSPDDVARMLGVSRRTIHRRIADGSIAHVRLGPRIVRIPASEVARLLGLH